ncbi:penicillin-binding protein 1a [compost metagenome]
MELSLSEQTLLAGLPNAPSAYALSTNPGLAAERQQMVIDAMVKYNNITQEQIEEIKNSK